MATYIYDADADALQVQLLDESDMSIEETVELGPTLHVGRDAGGMSEEGPTGSQGNTTAAIRGESAGVIRRPARIEWKPRRGPRTL